MARNQARQLADAVVTVTTADDLPDLLHRLLEAAAALTGAGRSELAPAGAGDGATPGGPAALAVPLTVGDRPWASLVLARRPDGTAFTADDEHLVGCLAAAAGLAIANRCLRHRLDEVEDAVVQRLFATGLGLQQAAGLAAGDGARDRIERAIDDLDETIHLLLGPAVASRADRQAGRPRWPALVLVTPKGG
jgi:hypothetical protein